MLEEGLSLEAIGARAGKHPSTVGYWVAKHGLRAVNADRHRSRGTIPRATLEALVERGLTIREIAAELDRSYATIRHWLMRYGLRSRAGARRDARGPAPAARERFIAVCRHHGEAVFIVRADGATACVRCRSEAVSTRRREIKARLVAEAGGACVLCGYAGTLSALHFHHLDPATKRFHLGLNGVTRSLDRARVEAAKCVLLCARCHAEVEAGDAVVPANSLERAAEKSEHGRG